MSNPATQPSPHERFVSRAGQKLLAAIDAFDLDPAGRVCADLGANVGGFTDCLLQHGAAKVYAVDTGYGVLAWTLRKDPRVVVRERTNALHVKLPESVGFVAIDLGWTRQNKILPCSAALLAAESDVVTLIKPHYESEAAKTQRGVLSGDQSEAVLAQVLDEIAGMKAADGGALWAIKGITKSPLEGQKGNTEYLAWLRLASQQRSEHS